MMNNTLLIVILLCSTLFFSVFAIFLFASKIKQRKVILETIKKSQAALKDQFANDEIKLKSASSTFLTPELQTKITLIIAGEKDCYNNLLSLYIDYHPAAIEMLPFFLGQVVSLYIDCIQYIILQSKVQIVTEESESKKKEEEEQKRIEEEKKKEEEEKQRQADEVDEKFQFEALIEQLRFEKQDFADKYKAAQILLSNIYLKYKDVMALDAVESVEKMKLPEIAAVFKIEIS